MPTTYTLADLANIESLIASGAQTVTFQGRTITLGNLTKIRAHIASILNANSATPERSTTLVERGRERWMGPGDCWDRNGGGW